ncbi:MAG: dihydrodipicolinate synthase family protein [Candidatus Brocadiia bacterium]
MEGLRIKGLVVPPLTPMRADGSVDLQMIEPLHGLMRDAGVRGAFVCGTTGESLSLTVQERMKVAERWLQVADEDFPIIVHVGHDSLPAAVSLAEHAARSGAAAVSAMAPTFFRPGSVGQLTDWCAPVAAAAKHLPFYYYHIPPMTRVELPMVEFLDYASERIPNLVGMKFSHTDMMELGRCVRMGGGRFDVMCGAEGLMLYAFILGCRAVVGTTFNVAAPLYVHLLEAFRRGHVQVARRQQASAVDLLTVLNRHGIFRAAKAATALLGFDCGPPRPPLEPVSEDEMAALQDELEGVGFFDYAVEA